MNLNCDLIIKLGYKGFCQEEVHRKFKTQIYLGPNRNFKSMHFLNLILKEVGSERQPTFHCSMFEVIN